MIHLRYELSNSTFDDTRVKEIQQITADLVHRERRIGRGREMLEYISDKGVSVNQLSFFNPILFFHATIS